ncbi:MAG: hypothetical protein PVF27_07140, partial [Gemmatimonadales bacterium]
MPHGCLAALLAVAVVIPYAHPALCVAAGHEGDRPSVQVAFDAPVTHDHDALGQGCHDEMACGIAPVGV